MSFQLKKFLFQWLNVFALLGVLFIPFSFRYFYFQTDVSQFLFEDILISLAGFFKLTIINPEISSDATTMYLLFFVLFFLALVIKGTLSFFSFWKTHQDKILKTIQLILTFYLALILLKYGFDKIFKAQFYLPEPNTLYTPLGMLEKDILFWSTMGASRSYNIFMGLIEVIPAFMLLHHKTRNLGLFIILGVIINVVCINFSFDISVKLFSSFLLLITLLLLTPNLKILHQLFVQSKVVQLNVLSGKGLIHSPVVRISIKSFVIILFLVESFFPYWQMGNFNDDNMPRNYLHGAYEVTETITSNTQMNLPPLKRIFIHRSNYFIFQYENETMEDYHLEISQTQQTFTLTNYDSEKIELNYHYDQENKTLQLTSSELGFEIHTKTLDWESLPLLQPLFHWTVDEVGIE